jgi:hypothetical protein
MSIHGKKEGIFRILGSFLILLSLILSIFFNILALNDLLFYLLLIIVVFPLFVMSVLLKLEQDIVVKNSAKFLLLLTVVVVVVNIIVFFSYNIMSIMKFVLIECSDLLLICCWHFSLSLYKRRKIIFVLSGIISFVLNSILWLSLGEILVIIVFIMPTLLLGILLIISSELMMKKKGLLNYI